MCVTRAGSVVMLQGACNVSLTRAQVTFLEEGLRLLNGHISRGWQETYAEPYIETESRG